MAQDITIKLANKPYPLTASTPEQEQLIRRAADEVNRRVLEYQAKTPEGQMLDFMSFAALNICMSYITLCEQLNGMNAEEKKMVKELEGYLKDIEKNSR